MSHRATDHDVDVQDEAGYWELVRTNTDFRRLWVGHTVSLLGDWFNTIALYTLVLGLTGATGGSSPLALAGVFIAKMLPWAFASPLAGLLVDRYDRRWIMIVSSLVRAVVVCGFLLIDDPSHLPWLYTLIVAQVVVGSVFPPAKSAAVPNVTAPRELLTANALSSATWSTMLAVGAALGGVATEALGPDLVFLIDSATYLVAAAFIFATTIPQDTAPADESLLRSAAREIADGWRHLRTHPRIGRIALAKATWAAAGGALVFMLALLGEQVSAGAVAAGIGVLFMARGIGTGIGPILARRFFTDRTRWPAVLGSAVAASGVCYGLVGVVPWDAGTTTLAGIIALVVTAHAASGGNWVLSTVMLQRRTEDRYRGRVFATEWLLVMGVQSISIFVAGGLMEAGVVDLRGSFFVFAALQVLCGLTWLATVVPRERRDDDAEQAAADALSGDTAARDDEAAREPVEA